MTDHIVAGIGPQVGSGSFADAAMVVARYIDAKVTLVFVSCYVEDMLTYLQYTRAKNKTHSEPLDTTHREFLYDR